MKSSIQLAFSIIACFIAVSSAQAVEGKTKTEVTKEVRSKMAEAHEKMAFCLKSDKSTGACRDEMRESMAGPHEEFGCGWGRGPHKRAFSKSSEDPKKK